MHGQQCTPKQYCEQSKNINERSLAPTSGIHIGKEDSVLSLQDLKANQRRSRFIAHNSRRQFIQPLQAQQCCCQ